MIASRSIESTSHCPDVGEQIFAAISARSVQTVISPLARGKNACMES